MGIRRLVVLLMLSIAAIAMPACGGDDGDDGGPPLPEVTDPLEHVDPTIGTGGLGFAYGSSFVGAAVPHGLVKLAPDTKGPFGTVNFQHYSGYWAGDDTIQAFTHLHLHGTGATDYGILAVMPTTAFDPAKTSVVDYEQRFAKADEHAVAGSYAVTLADGTAVELVATARGAHHVYDFSGASGTLVLDLAKTLSGGQVTDAEIHLDAATQTVRGRMKHVGGMSGGFGGYDLFFIARTRQAWASSAVWSGGQPAAAGTDATGTGVGAALTLAAGAPVELQVAVSLVSQAGAEANLAAELPAWDVAATRTAAQNAWRQRLEAVKVTGGTVEERRTFYTSLYHAFLMPTIIGDADGSFRLAGMTAPEVATGYTQMSDFSLWDTYRTVHPLYTWLAPSSARDSTYSLVRLGEGLGGCPRWPIAIGEAGTMLGASCDVAVADAMVKGIARGDATFEQRAWTLLREAAMSPTTPPLGRGGRDHVEIYMQLRYVPSSVGRSVSHTTEYAHDDFALANLGDVLGDTASAATLRERSHGWRALYDPSVGFLRARAEDGTFPGEFDALDLSDDYAEANAWHSLWMAGAHDVLGLAELLGGDAALVAKLETFFTEARRDWETGDPSAANFPRPYYWHGNEPDLNAAFLFAQAGRPDRTQEWARWIIDNIYSDTPEGVPGNDDGGTMGAWYVFATLGLYPVPGSNRYIVSAPIFEQARIVVDGHELVIAAPGVSPRRRFVAGVTIDGTALTVPELTHDTLRTASRIEFAMTDEATSWGRPD
ncbi:MAG TPA: GH92 family glycosyl hydrolase [Kofleriaceae bacterium]|nr:GH92 family glycosyl hydrolase [Kofleriaceae bacterium]